jgi:glycosyltransferase involved in cell wall biosynthesis
MKKSEKQLSLSVLMTAFNRQRYIAEAIESVLASTFKDFELIVVDDCSEDSTVTIARKYEALDNRVKVYVNEKNLGDYPNRIKAANLASGKYIKYLDSDDVMYPTCLETMVRSMESFDANFGLCCGVYPISPLPIYLNPKESFTQHYMGVGLFGRSPLSAIINREYYNLIGGFNEERGVSDVEFWFRCALHSGVVLIQDGMTWAREHPTQETLINKDIEYRYKQIEKYYLTHPNTPFTNDEIKKINYLENKKRIKFAIRRILKILFK